MEYAEYADEPRFWEHDCPPAQGFDEAKKDWVGVVDEEAGGIILYCHPDLAPFIINSLATAK